MKQLISLLLCFALCLSFMPNIYATEYDYVKVQIDAGNGILTEKAIVQDEDLYLPADFYSEVTRFTFYEDQSQFLIDGQSNDNATLKIEVNTKENALVISPIKEVKLSTIIEANDSIYLPLSTMLPVLHADVAEILDGIIYIANNDLSLWELLYSFDIEAYLFDYAAEFADNIWLGKLSYELPNWLLDSITNWRWDRLDIIYRTGDYNDYVDIFTEYLTDDEVYLQAMGSKESTTSMWLEIIGTTQMLNGNFNTVFEWGKEFESQFDTTDEYFDYLEAVMPYPHDLEDFVGKVNTDGLSAMDVVDIIEYYCTFSSQVEDHRLMLDAVYDLDHPFRLDSPEHRAAEHVFNLYGNNIADGILSGCFDKLYEEAINIATGSLKLYELTSRVTGIAMTAVFPHNLMDNAADISRLSLYERAMQSARSAYNGYSVDIKTDQDVNNLRCSILMALLSSRSCYNVMLNTANGYQDSLLATDYGSLISYYESRINHIDAMICLLYQVADNAKYDSCAHIDDFSKSIKQKINKSKIIDSHETSDFSDSGTTTDKENLNGQVNTDAGYTYRYSFDAGMLVLRTKNYDDIIRADSIPESKRKEYGFWYKENSDTSIQYENMVFCVSGGSEEDIIRYDSKGIGMRIFKSDGNLKLIGCADNHLYFYYLNRDENIEGFYRINNCTSDASSIDCLAEMECADTIANNLNNSIFMYGEWIYFLYTDDPDVTYDVWESPELWLYRLSSKTGKIERVSTVYNETPIGAHISNIKATNGYYILEGVHPEESKHYKARIVYLFDPLTGTCVQLCSTGCADSEFEIVDGKCYHLHQNSDGSVCFAKVDIQSASNCEVIISPVDAVSSYYSNLQVDGNTMWYSSYGTIDTNTSYTSYCTDLSDTNSSMTIAATQYYPTTYTYDGILYLFVNGAVVYARTDNPSKWYDSGVRYIKRSFLFETYSDFTFFSERDGQVYFVTGNHYSLLNDTNDASKDIDLNNYYNSTAIKLDYANEIGANSPIFNPAACAVQPSSINGAQLLIGERQDIWGNSYGGSRYNELNSVGIEFSPTTANSQTVQYDTHGMHKYMSGVIAATDWSMASGQLRFYADGNLIFESPVMTIETAPIEFTIDIKGAETVIVEAVSDDGYASDFSISCVFLVMDLVSFHDFSTPPYARYYNSSSSNESNVPLDTTNKAVDMNSISLHKSLTEYHWHAQGYRSSDTWDLEFYDTGRFVATNEVGREPFKGRFDYADNKLTLCEKNGQVYDEYVYDANSQSFISLMQEVLLAQDYVDEYGKYHDPVYGARTLVPIR